MEMSQLRYLVALAEERHFTRAAAREHIAQPALSQQIRRLEDEVGLPLVERTTRRVAMTDAGELLVARARRILAELEAAQTELRALRGVQSGHVTVGALHTMGPVDVSLVLASFHERYPAVELTVREYEEIRANPRRFVVLPGHEFPDVETLVESRDGYVIVEKLDQAAEVARLEALGARRVSIGQGEVSWVVMADPDGNEFDVLRPLTPAGQAGG